MSYVTLVGLSNAGVTMRMFKFIVQLTAGRLKIECWEPHLYPQLIFEWVTTTLIKIIE